MDFGRMSNALSEQYPRTLTRQQWAGVILILLQIPNSPEFGGPVRPLFAVQATKSHGRWRRRIAPRVPSLVTTPATLTPPKREGGQPRESESEACLRRQRATPPTIPRQPKGLTLLGPRPIFLSPITPLNLGICFPQKSGRSFSMSGTLTRTG